MVKELLIGLLITIINQKTTQFHQMKNAGSIVINVDTLLM